MEKIIKVITYIPRWGFHKGQVRPTGWSIVIVDGERTYRWQSDLLGSIVDYTIVPEGIYRHQRKGFHMLHRVGSKKLIPSTRFGHDELRDKFIAF